MSRSLMSVVCACALLASLMAFGTAQASAAAKPGPALKALVRQTQHLSLKDKALKRRLLASARLASGKAGKSPCVSVNALARYRRLLHRIHVSRSRSKKSRRAALRIAGLGPASLNVTRTLLKGRGTRRCGGGIGDASVKTTTEKVRSSSTKGLTVHVQLPDLRFVSRTGAGRTWTQLVLPDTDSPQKPGTPGIPIVDRQFAVPEGASVSVKAGGSNSYVLDNVDVYPVQPDSSDAATGATNKKPDFSKPPFAAKPFTFDAKAYAASGPTPAATGGMLGHVRDLAVGDLSIPAVQYDPKTRKLRVFRSLDVKVTFGGRNTGKFDAELGSPWERPARRGLADLLNDGLVLQHLGDRIDYRRCGEQMLVITNHDTRAAADTLATARSAAGLRTAVVETGAGAGQIGTTPAAIQAYIRGELTGRLCIHPSYVTIMGDDDLVPTNAGIDGIPSDLPYALRDNADELPDVAIGRIIGNDQNAVQTAVNKIVGYETTPPSSGDFLHHATVAADFQDDDADGQENRTFIQFAETVRNGLARRGVTVDRVYNESPAGNPQKLNDGTSLPASLKKPTFAWNGSGTDITNDWNAGRFLVVHRDHGWSDGWGVPSFGTADVDALTNGSLLPVLLSINCSSGAYDYDETSFAGQALVHPGGGAVGVFGDTRDSPSWHNTQIALGFVDALLPSILPTEGPATAQRMGDALINGKVRLAGLANPATDGSSRDELYLWHYFGDPSMQMWGGGRDPLRLDITKFATLFVQDNPNPNPPDPPYHVNVTVPAELNGQPISLLRGGEVVGEGTVENGKATIPALFGDGSVKPGELKIAVEGDGAAPVTVPVTVPAPPPPPPTATTLAQVCPESGQTGSPMTVTGTLTGAPAGSTVKVTFKAPNPLLFVGVGRTVTQDATTAADGSWTTSLTPNPGETGTWTITSAYAGDATHLASSHGPCQVGVISPLG